MKNILLLEPNKLFAQTCQAALYDSGYIIEIALTAQEAIDLSDKRTPDLIILEIQLARHNGVEFLYELRSHADWQHIPVIIYSHIAPSKFETTKKELNRLGVVNYLSKTRANLNTLIASVDDVLKDEVPSH